VHYPNFSWYKFASGRKEGKEGRKKQRRKKGRKEERKFLIESLSLYFTQGLELDDFSKVKV
jgi:hypothetical protein